MNTIFKIWSLIIISFFSPEHLSAQNPDEAGKITKEFDTQYVNTIEFKNKDGDVTVKTWDKEKVELVIEYRIEADDVEDIQTVLQAIRELEVEANGSTLMINTKFYTTRIEVNWLVSSRIKMKIPGRGTITLSDFEVNYLLFMPAHKNLKLENHYGNVTLPDLEKDAWIDLYDCKLRSGDFGNDLYLKLRYTEAVMGNAFNTKIEMYDSDLEIQEVSDLILNSKYSKIDIEKSGNVNIDLYDDKVYIDELLNLNGTAKYTSLFVGDIANSRLEVYDIVLESGRVNDLKLISKYSKINVESIVGDFEFDLYDDKINIGNVNTIQGTSKYTSFIFDNLEKQLKFHSSYDDDISIRNIQPKFEEVGLNGKYTKLNLFFEDGCQYELKLTMQYGKYELDGKKMEKVRYQKEGNQLYAAYSGPGDLTSAGGKVNIDLYSGNVNITNR